MVSSIDMLFLGLLACLCLLMARMWLDTSPSPNGGARRLNGKRTSFLQDFFIASLDKLKPEKKVVPRPVGHSTINNVTYMFVLGLDGSGAEVVTPIIATIAKSCNQHVVFKNTYVKSSRYRARSASISSYFKGAKVANYARTRGVVVLEDGTFPSENVLVNSTYEEKKENPRYNMQWMHDTIDAVGGVKQRYLYVDRDFYEAAASRPAKDGNFEGRLYSLLDYTRFLEREHQIISKRSPGSWSKVDYEWFVELRNCTALAAAIVDFAGWTKCDIDFACQLISDQRPELRPDEVNDERAELAAILAENTTIPTLVVNENAPSFGFETYVSDRKPFFFGPPNATQAQRWGLPPQLLSRPVLQDRWVNHSGTPRNNVSFMYIVGVEGTGHHGVTPAVASIAKTCGYHVIYENSGLRRSQSRLLPRTYQSGLNGYRYLKYPDTTKVLVIEDQSFPTDKERRNSTTEEKKRSGKYNLEWVFDQANAVGIDTRFLHLTRDFYKAVASHPEFDDTFERHAQVLHDFIWYIDAEYRLIDARKPGIWGTVHYEWFQFQDQQQCDTVVSAVIAFAGWDDCDVEFACQVLQQTIRNSTKRSVNETEYAYAKSFNVSVTIPELDISAGRSFSFRRVVSARVPFSFIHNRTRVVRHIRRPGEGPDRAGLLPPELADRVRDRQDHLGVPMSERMVMNSNVSILYLVGLRGAGHILALSTLGAIAQSCGIHVVRENKALRRAQAKLLPRSYTAALQSLQHSVFRSDRVLVLDGAPLYADGTRPSETSDQKRAYGKYNLAWLQGVAGAAGVEIRYLYLERPFAEVVAASYNDSVPFAVQVQTAHDFAHYADEERDRIEKKVGSGLWAQINTTMLVDAERCTELVTALARFAQWAGCDAAVACDVVRELRLRSEQRQQQQQQQQQHESEPNSGSTAWQAYHQLRTLTADETRLAAQYADKVRLNITALETYLLT